MKLNKEELSGYWFEANEETFNALVEAGYKIYTTWGHFEDEHVMLVDEEGDIISASNPPYDWNNRGLKQAYHHNGEFFTCNESGEILGRFLEEKAEFPELTKGDKVVVRKPKWMKSRIDAPIGFGHEYDWDHLNDFGKDFVKDLYENSKDFTVTWKLKEKPKPKDPHADLKKRKQELEALGYVVKREYLSDKGFCGWFPIPKDEINQWCNDVTYQLKVYKLDWDKVPSGTKIVVNGKGTRIFIGTDRGNVVYKWSMQGYLSREPKACRLPEGTVPDASWLIELTAEEIEKVLS
jgi:hypothetical protein